MPQCAPRALTAYSRLMSLHIWMRSETKPGEARAPLSPESAAVLVEHGVELTVESSPCRVFTDPAYAEVGCRLVQAGTWVDAPASAFILGLKELPEWPAGPLRHRHVYFAHCYKGQAGAGLLLSRFRAGGGSLLDLEYLVDERGERGAAFGYWAGFVGAALAALAWSAQAGPEPLGPLRPYSDSKALLEVAAAALARAERNGRAYPKALVIGAAGRSGQGAAALLRALGVVTTHWDRAETLAGGPFAEVLEHELLLNCVLVRAPTKPFLVRGQLSLRRALRVVVDVSCDVRGPHNPLPLHDAFTTFQSPTARLVDEPPLDIVTIDNLPSLLPAESSRDFSSQLLPHLLRLDQEGAWAPAASLFRSMSGASRGAGAPLVV